MMEGGASEPRVHVLKVQNNVYNKFKVERKDNLITLFVVF